MCERGGGSYCLRQGTGRGGGGGGARTGQRQGAIRARAYASLHDINGLPQEGILGRPNMW